MDETKDKILQITNKSFDSYSLDDVDTLPKLKMTLWQELTEKEWEYAIKQQERNIEYNRKYLLQRARTNPSTNKGYTEKDTRAIVEELLYEDDKELIILEIRIKEKKRMYNDLSDIITAIRVAYKHLYPSSI